MQGYKTCKVCGNATHNTSKLIVDNKCPVCGTVYPVVEKTKSIKPANDRELTLTAWEPGFKACKVEGGCGRFSSIKREDCVHCGKPFKAKEVDSTKNEAEVEDDETEAEFKDVAFHPTGLESGGVAAYEYPDHVQNRRCYVPAGACPWRLRSNNPDVLPAEGAIRAWAHKVRQTCLTAGTYLTNEALLYWARQELNSDLRFGHKSEEMEYLRTVLSTVPDIKYRRMAV